MAALSVGNPRCNPEQLTDSSTEAEYVCLSKAGRLGQWLRQLVPDLGTPILGPTRLHEDNAAAAKWAEGPCDFAKRRHIHRSYCTIDELVQGREDGSGKTFEIWMVPTDLQRAGLFTKSLGHELISCCPDTTGSSWS